MGTSVLLCQVMRIICCDQRDFISACKIDYFSLNLFFLFEVMILKLRDRLGVTAEAMRANHTNLE